MSMNSFVQRDGKGASMSGVVQHDVLGKVIYTEKCEGG